MSFKEQEQALFDLLFDNELRKNFISNPQTAFANYKLDQHEIKDFASIKPDALILDAAIRSDLLLGQIRRVFPLSFALIDSLENGKNIINSIIDKYTMRSLPYERAFSLGRRLRENMATYNFNSTEEKKFIIRILDAELGMAKASASLKNASLKKAILADKKSMQPISVEGSLVLTEHDLPCQDLPWIDKPVKLAAMASASIIPQPYQDLKTLLCNNNKPISASERKQIAQHNNPRLLISLAVITNHSICDPTVEFKTLELNDGFAQLLELANGTLSVAQILIELKNSGATDKILQSIESGFFQMKQMNMLEIH